MPDSIGPNADLRSTHRKIGLLALSVAGVAIAAMIFFVHSFGSKATLFVPLVLMGVLAMLIVGVTMLWRSRAR
jgi:hypothetical protein